MEMNGGARLGNYRLDSSAKQKAPNCGVQAIRGRVVEPDSTEAIGPQNSFSMKPLF